MRKRMTRSQGRRSEDIIACSVLAEIEAFEKRLAGVDEELQDDADAIADEEAAIAEESTGVSVDVGDDQNDKSQANWPVADREAVASSLVRMAALLLEEK